MLENSLDVRLIEEFLVPEIHLLGLDQFQAGIHDPPWMRALSEKPLKQNPGDLLLDKVTVFFLIALDENCHDEVVEEEGYLVRVANIIKNRVQNNLPGLDLKSRYDLIQQQISNLCIIPMLLLLYIFSNLQYKVWQIIHELSQKLFICLKVFL